MSSSNFNGLNVLVLGGSKNIGYFAAQRFLDGGATVNFMLRNTGVFDNDEYIKSYKASGKARLVKGDALNKGDVQKAWAFASEVGRVDLVLYTVGGTPKFKLNGGFIIDPPNLCTKSMINLLSVFPRDPSEQPKLILISSIGLSKESHSSIPILLKPVYGLVLPAIHADKKGLERVVSEAAGWAWKEAEPAKDIFPDGWKESIAGLHLEHVVIVRPALLNDGKCKADEGVEKPYRVQEGDIPGYFVSRKDTAHFIVEGIFKSWSNWEGKKVSIAN